MAAPTVRGRTAPAAGGSATSPAGTQVGDMVIVFTWERAGAGIPTHTLQNGNGFAEIFSHGHDDGSTDGRLSVGYKIATASGANSYQAYTSSTGTPEWWTGIVVLTAGTFAKGAVASSAITQTNNAVPNPPSVTLGNTRDWIALAIGAWHHGSSATITPTAPTNYGNLIEVAGASTGDIGIADRSLTAAASEDPGAFGDNIAPNGTVAATIGVGNPLVVTAASIVGVTGGIATSGEVIPGVETFERSSAVAATASIATSGQFFSILERASGLSAATAIATSGEHETPPHERSSSLDVVGGIATAAEFFSVLERSSSLAASGDIQTAGQRDALRSSGLSVTGEIATGFERDLLRATQLQSTGSIETSGHKVIERSSGLSAQSVIQTGHERELHRATGLVATAEIQTSWAEAGVVTGASGLSATAAISTAGDVDAVLERASGLSATGSIETAGDVAAIWERAVLLEVQAIIDTAGLVLGSDIGVPVEGPTRVTVDTSANALVMGGANRVITEGRTGHTINDSENEVDVEP